MSVAYDVPTPAGRRIRRTPAAVLPFPRRDDVSDVSDATDVVEVVDPSGARGAAPMAPVDVPVDVPESQVVGSAPAVFSPEGRPFVPEARVAPATAPVGLEPRALLVRRETGRIVAAVGAPAVDSETVQAYRPEVERHRVATNLVEAPAIAGPDRIAAGASRARVRLTVRGRRVVALLCAVALAAAVWITVSAVHGALAAPLVPSSAPAVVTVHPGDTLWSIASRLAPEHDPRAVVAALRERNHLASSELQAGQHLVVPR